MEAEERTETVAAEAAAAPEAAPAQEQGGAVRKRRTRARTGEKAGTVKSRKTRKKAAPESQTAESPAAPAPEEPEIVFPEDGVVNHQEKSPETESAAEALQEPPAAGDEVPADAGADDPEIPFPAAKSDSTHARGYDYRVTAEITKHHWTRVACEKWVYSEKCYLPEARDTNAVTCVFSAAEVPASPRSRRPVRFTVTPYNAFGRPGEPISATLQL